MYAIMRDHTSISALEDATQSLYKARVSISDPFSQSCHEIAIPDIISTITLLHVPEYKVGTLVTPLSS